jgi:aspartyl protease family protein
MRLYLLVAIVLVLAATQVPALLQDKIEDAAATQDMPPEVAVVEPEAQPVAKRNPLAGRSERIEADRRGHFVAQARLNGHRMPVLVDTGATLVAINESTARKLGIRLTPADFRYRARTANGETAMAAVSIGEISVGRVVVRDVEASVLRDDSLSGVLLGISFLKRLRRYEVDSGTLILTQ